MSSKTNTIEVNGRPGRGAEGRRHRDERERRRRDAEPGNAWASSSPTSAPKHALMSRIGASVPPEVPEPRASHQITSLPTASTASVAEREAAGEHVADRVVADAERPRHEQADDANTDGADDRVPELADGQPAEAVLDREQAPGDDDGEQAAGEAERREQRELAEPGEVVRAARENSGPAPNSSDVHAAGDARRDDQRDERPGRELEQQQLDGEHDGGERRAERRGHAGRGAAGEQDLALARPRRGATWPRSEPIAPPVTMIGPSAPNGPPVPMAIAADSGLATAVRGAIRLCWSSTASIASGMPWPRMTGAHFASSVTTAPPAIAVSTTSGPRWSVAEGREGRAPLMEEQQVGEDRDEPDEHPCGAACGESDPDCEPAEQQQPSGWMAGHAGIIYRVTM